MRITADVIDDEVEQSTTASSSGQGNASQQTASSSEQGIALQQSLKVQEVTKKFNALNLSDDIPSASRTKNTSAFSLPEGASVSPFDYVHNIYDEQDPSKTSIYTSPSFCTKCEYPLKSILQHVPGFDYDPLLSAAAKNFNSTLARVHKKAELNSLSKEVASLENKTTSKPIGQLAEKEKSFEEKRYQCLQVSKLGLKSSSNKTRNFNFQQETMPSSQEVLIRLREFIDKQKKIKSNQCTVRQNQGAESPKSQETLEKENKLEKMFRSNQEHFERRWKEIYSKALKIQEKVGETFNEHDIKKLCDSFPNLKENMEQMNVDLFKRNQAGQFCNPVLSSCSKKMNSQDFDELRKRLVDDIAELFPKEQDTNFANSTAEAGQTKEDGGKKDKEIKQNLTIGAERFKNSELSNLGDTPKVDDSPPQWMQQYVAKMKQEIKDELLDQLMNSTSELKGLSTAQHSSSFAVLKEDKFSHCQAEEGGEVIHSDIYCDNCDQLIHGIRYKCGNCSDFDLCQECESLPNVHNKNHIFLKIRFPNALKMYQKQKWSELMSPLPVKHSKHPDNTHTKNRSKKEKKLYEAKFLSDETVPDGYVIPPSTRFVKSWKVMNNGIRVWTHATKLHLIQGSADLVPSSDQIDVPHLKPGEEGIVSLFFTSPSTPGVYRSHWNFCHKSRPFGQIVWCHIVVKPLQEDLKNDSSETTDKLPEKIVNKQVEVSNIAQVLTAVKEDQDNNSMVPMKILVNSHTATPNNTPFALTPPKSPDHETLHKSVSEIAKDQTFLRQSNGSDNEDDGISVLSLNSCSDSDTEFVVIPMPKCFNLSDTFISQHLQLPPNLVETENIQKSLSEEIKEIAPVKNVAKKSGTVSQETGVPELSTETLISLENYVGCPETTHVTQVGTDGSSSEISIIESGNNSPLIENANQVFDSFNVKITTDNSSTACEVDKVELTLTDGPSELSSDSIEIATQEQIKVIPSSATFPKFPVEGITGEIFEQANIETNQTQWTNLNNPEEKTIQVLPEGLVFGALSAAASVYNTAKAVISTMQPKTENPERYFRPIQRMSPTVERDSLPANRADNLDPMDQLIEMGFCNRLLNESLLKKHNNDVASVVAELVSLNDNDWYASRHSPPSPPGFLD